MSLSFTIFRQRSFRLLLVTRMFSIMSLISMDVIIGWQIYSLTHDVLLLGLIGLTEALPAITCALFAGHIVDISRPHRVYMLAIGALLINIYMLALTGGGYIPLNEKTLVHVLFVGIFISGVARSFLMPSSFSLFLQIVPRQHRPAATSWLTGGWQVSTIMAPAIAGLIYGGYGAHGAWVIPALLISMAFLMINYLPAPAAVERPAKRDTTIASIKAGWAFIFKNPEMLSVMTLDMFAVLFGGAVAMLPAIADQVLHVGSEGLGALRAAPALGAIVTALIFALKPMKILTGKRLLFVVAGFGVCMIGFGLSPYFWLSMLFLAMSGAFDSVSMIMRSMIMQFLTPDDMRGRVSAVNSMFIISSNEIGAFESGLAAKWLGLVPSIVFGGVATLMVVATTAYASPKFRRLSIRPDELPKN